jgi:hypothetical protein
MLAQTSPTSGGRSIGIVRLRTKAMESVSYKKCYRFSCSLQLIDPKILCKITTFLLLQNLMDSWTCSILCILNDTFCLRPQFLLLFHCVGCWLSCLGLCYKNVMDLFFLVVSDSMFDTWFLMGGPTPVLCIVACYLYFVLKLGPKLMASRKPLNLKTFLIVYNFAMVILSLQVAAMVSLLRLPWFFISYCPFFGWTVKLREKPARTSMSQNSSSAHVKDTGLRTQLASEQVSIRWCLWNISHERKPDMHSQITECLQIDYQ